MRLPLTDRTEAGKALGDALRHYADRDDVIVLGLPRGGVPVAFEVARALHAPLDVMVVRKLGTPGQEELAMGAIATGDVRVLHEAVIEAYGIRPEDIEAEVAKERAELQRRERLYRGARPAPALGGRCVVLVDDGLATGSTMRAAVQAVRKLEPARVVVAVPVAPPQTVAAFEKLADEFVCLAAPEPFYAIGEWYRDFRQISDDEVRALLERDAATPRPGASA